MRLINCHTLEFKDFAENGHVPNYAILSHTWGEDEVTFKDWQDTALREEKIGFEKIQSTCRQALIDEYGYAWVDTNCIDKSSSAELSEAINSMFAWYERAAVCYVYMADVPPSTRDEIEKEDSHFRRSRWFTRGWTLQELIAPRHVVFYAQDWSYLGTKKDLVGVISAITAIDKGCLKGTRPHEYSIAEIMSWASARVTTRAEDQAYCLLGLFGVNMPLLYGEGNKAFTRLQENIIEISDDQSIFVCDIEALAMCAPLASSAYLFAKSGNVGRYSLMTAPMTTLPPFYTMTNAGLSITLPLIQTLLPYFVLGVLNSTVKSHRDSNICIMLSSHVSQYRHQYTKVSMPMPWFPVVPTSIKSLLPPYEESSKYPENWAVDFIPEEPTPIMISKMDRYDHHNLVSKILYPVKRTESEVFCFITFPRGLAGYRLYAADPPQALTERTSMMAMLRRNPEDRVGRGLLIFKRRGSRREESRYVAVYLETAVDDNVDAENWPRRCRVFPDWRIIDTLDAIPPFVESDYPPPKGRASWVGDLMATVRTAIPVDSSHMPLTKVMMIAEIVFDMDEYRDARGRKGSIHQSYDSPHHSLMLQDWNGLEMEQKFSIDNNAESPFYSPRWSHVSRSTSYSPDYSPKSPKFGSSPLADPMVED
ncbi:hypothetical protein CkaCkLH20_11898 [Colletotrichum karsti]|uniref:Heterokaryon incompatibility domain-containing protein n=1 Tax=Colletotrichum karsti TaxID=1095194 RepID=A0A9P6HVC5_9PEZI|nr:uncharacterized protein CkaCkLH20_11898 [Colletotrichum karsti]KAF9870592.1 hypothetical protein CkaCkLH20_11898 [Colletotrichum karsti]